ncbi:hypothetical protein VT84_33295 [Gemmata sp. SH-PL17]|uniref:hypothetical protein n=1 Tax=Gemmata sp. SH-PL17 TaxID=1630693 RepID=UPI00078C6961|nr:hypothetical protein [Gemmata sp. SH-PL17]AMV29319.1 hypothetical protein VT84_33295 [Gemmata sp. SH-PL17]
MYDAIECPHWFTAWVSNYRAALGVNDELTDAMLRIWWPAFEAARYTQADFAGVLPRLIVAESTPNWPREHLAAVNRELRAAKEQRTRRAPESSGGRSGSRCQWCGGDGWVSVPHPKCLSNGEWIAPHTTVTPACTRCDRGEQSYQAHCVEVAEGKRFARPMTIDQYEKLVGTAWVEIVARHEQAQRLMIRAVSATEGIDRTPNIKRLANAFAMPK